jgi:hypothetical protein
MRRGYDSEPVGSLISVRVYFGYRAPPMTPACLRKMSSSEGRSSRGGEWGGGVTSPSSSSFLPFTSSSSEDSNSEGVSSPHALTAVWAAFWARLLGLRDYNYSL